MNPTTNPTPDQKRAAVMAEFARRQGGQMPSSAGIGASATNNPAMGMPVQDMTSPPQPGAPMGGAEGTSTDGTMGAMKQQKGEAQKLTEAMIARSKALTQRGE